MLRMIRVLASVFAFLVLTSAASAQVCSPGTFGVLGMAPCLPCVPGSFSSVSGAFLCDLCPVGTAAPAAGSISCTQCAADTFAAIPGSVACLPCPAGTTAPPGSSACTLITTTTVSTTTTTTTTLPVPCAPGSFSLTGAEPCLPCAPGMFSSAAGAMLCDACPAGNFAGASGSSSCTLCGANTFSPVPGSIACLPCPPGSSSPPGATACTLDPTTTITIFTTTSTSTSSTTTTTLPALCGPVPATSCRIAQVGSTSIKVRNDGIDTKDQLKWRWSRGAATDLDDFKNPVSGTATYRLCLYDSSANPQPLQNSNVPAGGTPEGAACGSKPCWKATGSSGFSYKDPAATPDGITALKLRAGLTGKAKVQAKGKGVLLGPPAIPLALPVTMQLLVSDGITTECWQATYTTARVNADGKFVAKGP